jgi:glycerophosphoryl diester phosphodiesterase
MCWAQSNFPHRQAHAHNDYEHTRPLWDALQQRFVSVEADVHLIDGTLIVAHNNPTQTTRTLKQLYLDPLDSLIKQQGGTIYPGYAGTFYLMVDCKTEAETTYRAIQKEVMKYPTFRCAAGRCPITIFISGNRAVNTIIQEGGQDIVLDGRPDDLGKGIPASQMSVVSDRFAKWSDWNGKRQPEAEDLKRIWALAQRVHAEGKKLRLWAIPDNELTWTVLMDAGVDIINTDQLERLHAFLEKSGR